MGLHILNLRELAGMAKLLACRYLLTAKSLGMTIARFIQGDGSWADLDRDGNGLAR